MLIFEWIKFVDPLEISPALSRGRNALFHYTHLLQCRDVKEINNMHRTDINATSERPLEIASGAAAAASIL